MSAFPTSCFILSATGGKIEQRVCYKFCVKLGKSAAETLEMLREAFGEHSLRHTEFHLKMTNVQVDQAPAK
jgi:hypothetical protein